MARTPDKFDSIMITSSEAIHEDSRYGFHDPAVLRNVAPPVVRFERPLRWWSLDRRRRRLMATALRDQQQHAILRLRRPDTSLGWWRGGLTGGPALILPHRFPD